MSSSNNSMAELFDTEELLALAHLDINQNQYDEALWKLKRVLQAAEPPMKAISMAARLYAQIGLFHRAQALFNRYIELDADAVTETFQLGMTYLDAGNGEEALQVWDKLLQKHPTHPPAMFYRGLVQAQRGELAAARMQLEHILKTVPSDNLYFTRARDLLQELGKGAPVGTAKASDETGGFLFNKDAYKTVQ